MNNILPTRENLFRGKIIDLAICQTCLQEEELVIHVLWNCHTATDVWAEEESLVQKWVSNEVDLIRNVRKDESGSQEEPNGKKKIYQ